MLISIALLNARSSMKSCSDAIVHWIQSNLNPSVLLLATTRNLNWSIYFFIVCRVPPNHRGCDSEYHGDGGSRCDPVNARRESGHRSRGTSEGVLNREANLLVTRQILEHSIALGMNVILFAYALAGSIGGTRFPST